MKYDAAKSSYLYIRYFLGIIIYFGTIVLNYSANQYIRFEHITSQLGISQKSIFCITQDRRGFIWFGTNNALNRFDGYNIKKYTHNPNDPYSLPLYRVISIIEDKSGKLWIGTEGGGLCIFDPKKEIFRPIPIPSDGIVKSSPIKTITTILEDQNGLVWIGTWGGLYSYNPKNENWRKFIHHSKREGTISDDKIRALFQDRKGILWIGTEGGGLNSLNITAERFTHFVHNPNDQNSLTNNVIYDIFEDRKGNLWVGTQNGLDLLDRETNIFKHFRVDSKNPKSLSNNIIRAIFEDSEGKIWIGTYGGGINILSSISEKSFHHYYQSNVPNSLSANIVLSIMEDNSGIIWIGTFAGGINCVDPRKQILTIRKDNNDLNGLSGNSIFSIFQDQKGFIWIGTFGNGLNRYNPNQRRFKHYKYNPNNPNSLSSNMIIAIHEHSDGLLWIGTWKGGINCLNRETGNFSHFRHNELNDSGPGSNDIQCFRSDQENNLWIGTWNGGLNMYDNKTKTFQVFKNDPKNPKSIASNGVTCIFPDIEKKDLLWIGTHYSGLECFNRKTNIFIHYPANPDNKNSLSQNWVTSIHISENNPKIVWIGTNNGGLHKFDKTTNQWYQYTEKDGLANNTIYGILEDDNCNLWISTSNGLSKFNPIVVNFKNYYAEVGLQGNEYNEGAFFKTKKGQLYFGGTNGLSAFFPENVKSNTFIPPIVITEFKVLNNQKYNLKNSILETKEILLSYRDSFSFEFAALNFTAPTKNQYAYMMEGLDDNWIPHGNKRYVNYPGLPHGKYIFKVKGSNNEGIWNEVGTSLRIIVTPPFWKTLWFKIIISLMTIGVIFILFKLRIRRYKIQRKKLELEVEKRTQQLQKSNLELKKSEKNLKELNATKDKFFSIISHDLKNHLTALLGFSDMLYRSYSKLEEEKKHKYTRSIDRSAKDLYDLLDNLLQWARSQTGGLQCKPRTIDLGILIPEIISIYSINAKKKKIELFHEVSKEKYVYADKNMIRTVLRNLISNAIKFTHSGGEIRIIANENKKMMEISVIDTGIGISNKNKNLLFRIDKAQSTKGTAKEEGTGLGLILCKEFIEKNNGDIWFESPHPENDGIGSIFRFTLPLPPKNITAKKKTHYIIKHNHLE